MLPGMILARIDGKSPVEYLTQKKDKNKLRKIALELIEADDYDFDTVANSLVNEK